MTTNHPTPNTDAVIDEIRAAVNKIRPAARKDIEAALAAARPTFVAARQNALDNDDPVAAQRVIDAEQAARTATTPEEVEAAAATLNQQAPAPALAAEPRPAVVRETVVVHDDPTPDVAPVAAPAATEANNDEPGWLRGYDTRRIQPLVEAIDDHEARIANLEDAVLDDNGNVRSSFSQGGLKKGPALAVLLTVWLIGYIITGVIFGWFSWPAWVIVPVIALIASAVTLVISNGHRRTTHNHDA